MNYKTLTSTGPAKFFGAKNKFGAKKVVVDGITFHSKREAEYYGQLKMMKAGGLIICFERQVSFKLFAFRGQEGKSGIEIGKHVVDFIVTFRGPMEVHQEAHEVKGFATAIWKLKKKIFEANYPHIPYKVIK